MVKEIESTKSFKLCMDVGVICYGSSGGSSGDQVNDQIQVEVG